MKRLFLGILALAVFGAFSAPAFAAANELAKGVETVTHAPFAGLRDANDKHAHPSLKEAGASTLGAVDTARRWLVEVGFNLGQKMDE